MKASALSTHVLDNAAGRPAAGVAVELWRTDGGAPERLWQGATNADGRTDEPILPPERFRAGRYELRFRIGDYFAARGQGDGFLNVVAINVGLREGAGHYHVPLSCTPWAYNTYRGS